MARTKGLGVPSTGTTLGGAPITRGGKIGGGSQTPSYTAAAHPAGRALGRIAKSVGSIPAATPKAGKTPSVQPKRG